MTGENTIDDESGDFAYRVRREAGGFAARFGALWQRWWFRWMAYLLGLALLGVFLIWLLFARNLPSADSLLEYQSPLPTMVRGIDGNIVQSYARERRVQLAYPDYPERLVNAYLAAEDKTFFSHGGLDYPGLVRAAFEGLTSGSTPRGTSTITQQVAKNLLLTNEVTYTRKLREAILAYRIENVLTKEDILELYLNEIYLGRNAYGVQAAARAYYGKDVGQLALHEMAYLSILPKGPANYRPESATGNARAIARRNYVLREMEDNGWITAAEEAAAKALPLGTIARQGDSYSSEGGYFIEQVRRELIDRYCENAGDCPYSVYGGGLWVRTSLDTQMQKATTQALRDGLLRYDSGKSWSGPIGTIEADDKWQSRLASTFISTDYSNWRVAVVLGKSGGAARLGFADGDTGNLPSSSAGRSAKGGGTAFSRMRPGDIIVVAPTGGNGYALRNIPEVSGGMVVQQPSSGRILAMQGGFDSRISSFNRASQAQRQPGSTIKPFVYATALDAGMTPATQIVDGTFCVYQSASLGNKCFRNFGGSRGGGARTMRWGLEQSRNLMTVRAANDAGMPKVVKTFKTMGIGDYQPYLSFALGAGDTTVEKMTNAYSMLVNHGRELKPTVIDYVQDRTGKVIYRADNRRCDGCNMARYNGKPMPRLKPAGRQLMDAMTAYQVVHMLEGVITRGTAQRLKDLNRPMFGKTGTSTGPTNVWFVGGTPDVVAGVYMGFDQPRSLGGYAQGGSLAAPIFKQFAKATLTDMPKTPFVAPRGIRMVRIERNSGRKVFAGWPGDDPKSAIIWEAFKPETEPRRSIRGEELAAVADKKADAAVTRQRRTRPANDNDFLQDQGGIY